jgi:hypothetical protein
MTDASELPRDLDGQPYRIDTPIGPWKVSPCCGAFVEWSATSRCPTTSEMNHRGWPRSRPVRRASRSSSR